MVICYNVLLKLQYYIGKYWFLSLKNMIIINLSFWTCHKKFIRNMFTIWIIIFETSSISLSVILALGMQKIFFGCNNNHMGFFFSFIYIYIYILFFFIFLFFKILSSLSIFSLNYLFCFTNFLSLLWVFLRVQFFSLVRVRKLVCELYKGKKTLYTTFILISHFILRFGETSVQFGGTLQISLVFGIH